MSNERLMTNINYVILLEIASASRSKETNVLRTKRSQDLVQRRRIYSGDIDETTEGLWSPNIPSVCIDGCQCTKGSLDAALENGLLAYFCGLMRDESEDLVCVRRQPLSQTVIMVKVDAPVTRSHFLPHAHQAVLDQRQRVQIPLAIAQQFHSKVNADFSVVQGRRLPDRTNQIIIRKPREQILASIDDFGQTMKLRKIAKVVRSNGND